MTIKLTQSRSREVLHMESRKEVEAMKQEPMSFIAFMKRFQTEYTTPQIRDSGLRGEANIIGK